MAERIKVYSPDDLITESEYRRGVAMRAKTKLKLALWRKARLRNDYRIGNFRGVRAAARHAGGGDCVHTLAGDLTP